MLKWLAKKFEKNRANLQARLEQSLVAPSTTPPTLAPNWRKLGNEALKAGNVADAARCYQNAVRLAPDNVAALVNLAFAKSELELHNESRPLLERAIALDASNLDAWYMLGGLHERDQNLPLAKAAFLKVIALQPDFELAYRDLCRVLFQSGELESAKQIIQRGIDLNPSLADFHFYLGNVIAAEGDATAAQACFEKALALRPDFANAHWNLGHACEKQQKLEEALQAFQSAAKLEPESAVFQNAIGNIHFLRGQFQEAYIGYRSAVELDPLNAQLSVNVGLALHHQGEVYGAIHAFRNALKLSPEDAVAQLNLGGALLNKGSLKEAIQCYRRILQLDPQHTAAHQNLLFAMTFDPACSPQTYLQAASEFGRKISARAKPFTAWDWALMPTRGRPLRIGLVSGDLRNHPVGNFLEAVLGKIDPTKLTLVAYSTWLKSDQLTARIKPFFAEWNSVTELSDTQFAAQIHADKIDILLDLAGHTANNRLPVFAWRAAPVQVAWLGYWASTGVSEMDYILLDAVSVPPANSSHFSEQPWYLPDTRFCFTPPVTTQPITVSDLPAISKRLISFGSFQILSKINDAVLALWSRVLAALPDSRLRLQNWQLGFPAAQQDMLARLAAAGIDPGRVDIHGGATRDDYLNAYSQVDIVLDTFPFPGGTTTAEALWMGVPTITLTGATLLARQGESLLRCVGLGDWVASSEDQYVDLVVGHAQDLKSLRALRLGLRARALASPLFDAGRFANRFQHAMIAIWSSRIYQCRTEPDNCETKPLASPALTERL